MADTNVARELLWPSASSDVLVRVVWLYVGQGSSILVLVADGDEYRSLLLDINLDEENGGIDVPELVHDLLGDASLDVFANTHPHDDHLRGVTELSQKVAICQVWHSGHLPGKEYRDSYDELQKLIAKVKRAKGAVVTLEGSRELKSIGDGYYYVLAPAEYVGDDINDEKPDARYRRIHEHCAVLRFGFGDKWVLVTGDADRTAFKDHITDYHRERLGAVVLDASHHGSRRFFKVGEDDEDPYLDAINAISPEYVVISAPTSDESPHDHPHEDAVKLYEDQVGKGSVLHTGAKRYCFICDIYRDGTYAGVYDDKGALAAKYGLGDDSGDKGLVPTTFPSKVDDRSMGL